MSKQWLVREAEAKDDRAIRELLKDTAQDGLIKLGFEREPSYFNAISVSYCKPEIYVYEDLTKSRVVGMFSAGQRELYINGKPQLVRYTADLRVHPEYQGTRVMFRMVKQLKSILGDDGWAHTVILSDNQKSLDTVSKARGGMPQYFHQCTFHTYTIPQQRKLSMRAGKTQTRPANYNDIPAMQVFFDEQAPKKQFFPCYDFSKLNDCDFYQGISISNFHLAFSDRKVIGILGLWNQENFKQTRVIDYKSSFIRYINNILLRGIKLPKKGGSINYNYVHSLLLENNSSFIFKALLHSACQTKTPMVIGLDSTDPLNNTLKPLRKHTLKSEHFLTTYADRPPALCGTEFPYTYPEIARL